MHNGLQYVLCTFQDTAEFDLQFEKASEKFEKYKWVASSLTEKTSFIACIYKVNFDNTFSLIPKLRFRPLGDLPIALCRG